MKFTSSEATDAQIANGKVSDFESPKLAVKRPWILTVSLVFDHMCLHDTHYDFKQCLVPVLLALLWRYCYRVWPSQDFFQTYLKIGHTLQSIVGIGQGEPPLEVGRAFLQRLFRYPGRPLIEDTLLCRNDKASECRSCYHRIGCAMFDYRYGTWNIHSTHT